MRDVSVVVSQTMLFLRVRDVSVVLSNNAIPTSVRCKCRCFSNNAIPTGHSAEQGRAASVTGRTRYWPVATGWEAHSWPPLLT